MRIFLHEITDQETELDFTESEPWVRSAVEKVDETGAEERECAVSLGVSSLGKDRPSRPIQVRFTLRQVDDVVVLSGRVRSHVELLCSRCATPFPYETAPRFSALFCRDPAMAGIAHLETKGRPAGQNQGFARHAHDPNASRGTDSETSQDLDITYLAEDYIELGDVLTEQLRLLIPFQPLCRESCKGICATCGTDLNQGRCACALIAKKSAFSALQDLNLKLK